MGDSLRRKIDFSSDRHKNRCDISKANTKQVSGEDTCQTEKQRISNPNSFEDYLLLLKEYFPKKAAVSIEEAADLFCISYHTIYRKVKIGIIKTVRIGKTIRISLLELAKLLSTEDKNGHQET